MNLKKSIVSISSLACVLVSSPLLAQDVLPYDNGLATYHTTPQYRESEAHPLRVLAYIVHPVGWVLREVIFRPLSYFASSTETTRSVMGFRDPYDYRQPECFSADDSVPDCRGVYPFNYDGAVSNSSEEASEDNMEDSASLVESRNVFFPDVNFDFDSRKLNELGKGKTRQIAGMLNSQANVHVVLQGHADFIGSESYNEKLGLDRAEAVRNELLSLGVSGERLSSVTFGESRPVFSEQEDWARAINRRVEVREGERQGEVKGSYSFDN